MMLKKAQDMPMVQTMGFILDFAPVDVTCEGWSSVAERLHWQAFGASPGGDFDKSSYMLLMVRGSGQEAALKTILAAAREKSREQGWQPFKLDASDPRSTMVSVKRVLQELDPKKKAQTKKETDKETIATSSGQANADPAPTVDSAPLKPKSKKLQRIEEAAAELQTCALEKQTWFVDASKTGKRRKCSQASMGCHRGAIILAQVGKKSSCKVLGWREFLGQLGYKDDDINMLLVSPDSTVQRMIAATPPKPIVQVLLGSLTSAMQMRK